MTLVLLMALSLTGCCSGKRLSPPRDAQSVADRQDNPKTIALPVPPAPEEPDPVTYPRPNPPVTEGE